MVNVRSNIHPCDLPSSVSGSSLSCSCCGVDVRCGGATSSAKRFLLHWVANIVAEAAVDRIVEEKLPGDCRVGGCRGGGVEEEAVEDEAVERSLSRRGMSRIRRLFKTAVRRCGAGRCCRRLSKALRPSVPQRRQSSQARTQLD